MKYLLVYIDSYNRSECIRRFETKEKMNNFIAKDEVREVLNVYELREIKP